MDELAKMKRRLNVILYRTYAYQYQLLDLAVYAYNHSLMDQWNMDEALFSFTERYSSSLVGTSYVSDF